MKIDEEFSRMRVSEAVKYGLQSQAVHRACESVGEPHSSAIKTGRKPALLGLLIPLLLSFPRLLVSRCLTDQWAAGSHTGQLSQAFVKSVIRFSSAEPGATGKIIAKRPLK